MSEMIKQKGWIVEVAIPKGLTVEDLAKHTCDAFNIEMDKRHSGTVYEWCWNLCSALEKDFAFVNDRLYQIFYGSKEEMGVLNIELERLESELVEFIVLFDEDEVFVEDAIKSVIEKAQEL